MCHLCDEYRQLQQKESYQIPPKLRIRIMKWFIVGFMTCILMGGGGFLITKMVQDNNRIYSSLPQEWKDAVEIMDQTKYGDKDNQLSAYVQDSVNRKEIFHMLNKDQFYYILSCTHNKGWGRRVLIPYRQN